MIRISCVVALAAVVSGAHASQAPPGGFDAIAGVRSHSGRLLVRPVQPAAWVASGLTPGQAASRYEAARRGLGPWRVCIIDAIDTHVVSLPADMSEHEWADDLLATGDYEFVEPDWIVSPASTSPDDPWYPNQWHLDAIHAPAAWDIETGDGSITCAIVDTGVDLTHPDLAAALVPGFNAVTRLPQGMGGQVSDVSGHGTAVAGTAGAVGNNAIGGSGVGWGLRIMPVRASNFSSGSAFLSDILYGAIWAAANGARVVNVSFAGVENQAAQATGAAITANYGGLLFWAAGNSGTNLSWFDWPDVVVVGSTDVTGDRAPDSCWGRALDIGAPGVGLYVCARGGGYAPVSGTSYASPVAAASAAMVWTLHPSSTPAQVMNLLYSTCGPLRPNTESDALGAGRVDLGMAITGTTIASAGEINVLSHTHAVAGELLGLRVKYYACDTATTMPPFTSAPIASALAKRLEFLPATWPGNPLATNFAAQFTGLFWVPVDAPYTFVVESRDGANLYVGGSLVVVNDGLHPLRSRSGTVTLEGGYHEIRVDYFTRSADSTLVVRVRGGGQGDAIPNGDTLSHDQVAVSIPTATRR
ncbi:MAG: S8 family serine peptidase [Phycisphaerales bacterium]